METLSLAVYLGQPVQEPSCEKCSEVSQNEQQPTSPPRPKEIDLDVVMERVSKAAGEHGSLYQPEEGWENQELPGSSQNERA
ncbi:hypothetical protein BSKO_10643 [Bryopsis sp. KO-2023]|nr:hypothetical protein BSKO_10643 [Bryopsis sp. KO-2023]